MKTFFLTTALAASLAMPVYAESHSEMDLTATGDIEGGEKAFRKCQSCHVVADPEGNILAGRKSKTGPNLYGVVGRQAGTVEDFRYGPDIVAAGEAGLVFDEATFVAYVMDPKAAIQEATGDGSARSKMSFRVRKEDEARDLYAFLKDIGPDMDAEMDSGS